MSPEAEAALARRGVRYLPQLMLAPHTELAAHLKVRVRVRGLG